MGGGGPKKQVTTTGSSTIDPQTAEFRNYVYDAAKDLFGREFTPYSGDRVAGLTGDEQYAMNATRGMEGYGAQNLADAMQGARNAMGYTPEQVQYGQIRDADVQSYMSPYTQAVTNRGLDAMNRQLDQRLAQNRSGAIGAGAGAGSRAALTNAVLTAEGIRGMGDYVASQNANAYNQALGLAQSDINNRYQQDVLNQNLGLSGQQFNLTGAQNLATLAQQDRANQYQDIASRMAIGGAQRGLNQQALDNAYQDYFYANEMRPAQQFNFLLGALGASPTGQQQTQTQDYYGGLFDIDLAKQWGLY